MNVSLYSNILSECTVLVLSDFYSNTFSHFLLIKKQQCAKQPVTHVLVTSGVVPVYTIPCSHGKDTRWAID